MTDRINSLLQTKNKLEQVSNELLIRIAGVTDEVLMEQLREEYQLREKHIHNIEDELDQLIIDYWWNQHIDYYNRTFISVDNVYQAFTGVNKISEDFKTTLNKARMKFPDNLGDRRKWLLLANLLKSYIVIAGYDGVIVDEIGTGDTRYIIYIYKAGALIDPTCLNKYPLCVYR